MLTADTITDEQIREMGREAEGHTEPRMSEAPSGFRRIAIRFTAPQWKEQFEAADVALHSLHTAEGRGSAKYKARARCAEILNARAVSK